MDRFRFPKKGTAANEAEFLTCQSFHKKSTPRRSQHGSGAEPLLPHCGRRLAKGRIGGPGRACTRGRKCVARFSDRTASASERPTQQDPLGPRTPGYWPAIKKLQGNQPGVLGHVNTFQIAPSLSFLSLKEAILACDQPGVLGHVNTFQIAPSLTFRALKEAILACDQPGVLGHGNTFQIAPSLTFRALKEAILECDQPGCFWTSSGHGRDPHARASGSY